MKALCQLILGVVIASTLHAQTLSLNKDTFNVPDGYSDAYEIIGYGTIYNHTSDSVDVVWVREMQDLANDWETAVCDNIQCYLPGISSSPAPFTIPGNSQSNFDVHFYPNDIPGDGSVLLKAWVVNDSANTVVSGVFNAKALQPTVGVKEKMVDNLLIYPNPAKDFVMIKNLPANEVSTVEVYNIFGRKLLAFSQPPMSNEAVAHKFDLTALAKGIYMIRVFDGDMNVIYTKSLSKE